MHQLEALEDGKITEHGKAIHQLPCHPRLAHMLILAQNDGLAALACDIAAILEERDPLSRESGIDINLRIEALRRYRTGSLKNKRLKQIARIAEQYQKMLNEEADNSGVV